MVFCVLIAEIVVWAVVTERLMAVYQAWVARRAGDVG